MNKLVVLTIVLVMLVAGTFTTYAQGDSPPDPSPPSIGSPTLVATISTQGDLVELSWTAISGADAYDIYFYASGSWNLLSHRTTATSFSHQNPSPGIVHWYTVRAVDDGYGGPWSNQVEVNVPWQPETQSPPTQNPGCPPPPAPEETATAVPPPEENPPSGPPGS